MRRVTGSKRRAGLRVVAAALLAAVGLLTAWTLLASLSASRALLVVGTAFGAGVMVKGAIDGYRVERVGSHSDRPTDASVEKAGAE